ncbi:DUF6585 family protein [Kitasatospora sp. NPDC088346]|uniref:DUF6585 family protein n=1 Tax=Kitasatospora sp. NPDC088346 TaxID=3364073 RepID=UPI0038055A45
MAGETAVDALGHPVKTYLPDPRSGASTRTRRLRVNLTVAAVMSGFALLGLSLAAGGKPLWLALLPLLLGGAAFASIWVSSMRVIDAEPADHVELYEHGLATRSGRRVRTLLWSETAEYRVGAFEPPMKVTSEGLRPTREPGTRATLQRADGSRVEIMLSGVRDGAELRETIGERTVAVLLPPAVETVRAGGAVAFGGFSLDSTGIHHDGRTVTWGELDHLVDAAGARIAVQDVRGRQWFTTRTSDFPNLPLFRALAGRLHTGHTPG